MKGIQAYNLASFHPGCTDTQVVDNAGFLFVYCRSCKVLARVETVGMKCADAATAAASRQPGDLPAKVPQVDRTNAPYVAKKAVEDAG